MATATVDDDSVVSEGQGDQASHNAARSSTKSCPTPSADYLAAAVPTHGPVRLEAVPISRWRYQPFNSFCVDVRATPDFDAERTDYEVRPGEVLDVVEELPGDAGVLFLRLADGRGWLFDQLPGDRGGGMMCVRDGAEGDLPHGPSTASSAPGDRARSAPPETRRVPLKDFSGDSNDRPRFLFCLPRRRHDDSAGASRISSRTSSGFGSLFRSHVPSALLDDLPDDLSHTSSTMSRGISGISKPSRQGAEPVGPGSFSVVRFLGRGASGAVFQVSDRKTQKLYAMKTQQKDQLSKDLLLYAVAERNVLKNNNHPYVVSLHCAFQTPTHLVLVLQYGPRGSLQQLLARERRLEVSTSRLYEAEVFLGVCHLHERQIVFRDLKPENVVLDEKGHCLLTDFGSSKLGVSKIGDASTFCGSPHFVAPEILAMKNHGPTVDIYGLGVLLFTMITGLPPFYHPDMDQMYANIRSAPLRCPAYVPESAISFITQTMARNPAKRPGAKCTADLLRHAFFEPFASSWDALMRREVELSEHPSMAAVEFWMKAGEKKAPLASDLVEDIVGRNRGWSTSKMIHGWDVPPASSIASIP